MSFKLIILAPPSHFPIGLTEFIQTYPGAKIEIYHSDYHSPAKFRRISIFNQSEPSNKNCDLLIQVTESPLQEETGFPVIVWPLSRGSLDLRHFTELVDQVQETCRRRREKEVQEQYELVQKDHGGYDLSWWDDKTII